eukprot:1563115-Pleurochrysis_carterae.AAC.2
MGGSSDEGGSGSESDVGRHREASLGPGSPWKTLGRTVNVLTMRVPPGDECSSTVMAGGWSLSQAASSFANSDPGGAKSEELALVSELVAEQL